MELKQPATLYSVKPALYQETDGGPIPTDWRYLRLTDVARLESGHTPSRRKPSYWAGDIPWVSLHDTQALGANEITQTAQTISAEGLENSSARLLPKGTVVFSRTATVGKASIMGREMATSQDFANYICGPDVYNRYLAYLFRHMAPEWKKLMAGSIHNTVYMPVFRALRVVLPPRDEQQAIAEALSDADALIESLVLLLAKKRQIKQGAMQELLTGKKRLPGFQGSWKHCMLGDVVDNCSSGATPYRGRDDYFKGSIRWITSGELNYNVIFETIEHISAEAQKATNIRLHPPGTFLMAITGLEAAGTRGACGIVGAEATTNQSCMAVYPSRALLPSYLFHYYVLRGNELALSYCQGTKQQSYTAQLVKLLPISMPSDIEEQAAIVQVLAEMDEDVAAIDAKLSKARQVKNGMMQELLTGRIRLVSPVATVISLPTKPATKQPSTKPTHNWQINEAVVIGVLAQRFGSEQFPLPRKRRVKLMYLLHRHAEGKAGGYLKKAAGPYDPNTKYKGPEQIALKNGYVRALRNDKYEGFVAGDKIEHAQRYFEQWYGMVALDWLERFHYRKTDDLELLATVDMAMVDLAASVEPVDVAGVKRVIAMHPEWLPKLSRQLFSDDNIANAIAECRSLFSG